MPANAERGAGSATYFETEAAPAGSGLYYACLFAEPEYRPPALAVHTLENELLKSLHAVQDPGVARLKLQWWREEIGRAANAEARHPLGQRLQPYLLAGAPEPAELVDAIDALEQELVAADPEDFESLLQQYRVHFGPFWRVSAAACGIRDETALMAATTLGALHHLSRSLQTLPQSLARGSCRPLPRHELAQAGLSAESLSVHDAGRAFLRCQTTRLRERAEQAWRDYPADHAPALLHGLILVRLDAALLAEIERHGARLLERSYSLTPLRRLWIAWRTRRQVLRGAVTR